MEQKKSITSWTASGALDELAALDKNMPDRAFAFVLGSGASFASGIPTGKTMAENWLNEIHLRECSDGLDRNSWIASGKIEIEGLTWNDAASFYPQIFERRFRDDPESGFASLEAAMDGKEPSLGYSLLAEIMQHTRHKVVVTTNFDNLVADALAIHAHKPPLIVGHESLTGYVRPLLRRPLVAKIHRDLFFHPKNDKEGVDNLENGWTEALGRLFKHYMPLVIGYGGNDGSLMGFFNELNSQDIAGRILWFYRIGSPPSQKVIEMLEKNNGVIVEIDGFDEFMLRLASKLIPNFDMEAISSRIEDLGKQRAKNYRSQAEKLTNSDLSSVTLLTNDQDDKNSDDIKSSITTTDQKPLQVLEETRQVLAESFKESKTWWSWEMRAKAEPNIDKRNAIYLEGIKIFPKNAELRRSYGNFLSKERKNLDSAEEMFKKAIELDPKDSSNVINYAIFLCEERKDLDTAEIMFKKAIELDPKKSSNIINYAIFLEKERKDIDAAENLFKQAIELSPNNPEIITKYATFLGNERKNADAAEALFQKAIELDPNNPALVSNYAMFLSEERKDLSAAEIMLKKAIELDPKRSTYLINYATFLEKERKDIDAAETLFKKAIELSPNNPGIITRYAAFLGKVRKDLDAAETLFKKAIKLDPNNPAIITRYAAFLGDERKNVDAAETLFKKAIKLDPNNPAIITRYAAFLGDECKNVDAAALLLKRALELDPNNLIILSIYAALLIDDIRNINEAEEILNKVLTLDPTNGNANANLAYVKCIKGDFDEAEIAALRAIDLAKGNFEQFVAEALFYLVVIRTLKEKSVDQELGKLKNLLLKGYKRGEWNFDALISHTFKNLDQNIESFYKAIAAAILNDDLVLELEEFELWKDIKVVN